MKQLLVRQKEAIKYIMVAVAAFLGSYGVNYMYSLMGDSARPEGFLSVLVFGMSFILLKMTWENVAKIEDKKAKVKRLLFASCLAILFCAMLIIGYQLQYTGVTLPGIKGKGLIAIYAVCMSFVALPFTNALFAGVEKVFDGYAKTDRTAKKEWNAKYVLFIGWLGIFLCWIPVFLAYYPAIMSHDFHRQSIEAAGGFHMFDPYQPLAHTWLIWLVFQIGNGLGSLQTGMAIYSIFQMLVFSFAAAYSCFVIYRLMKSKVFVVIWGLFCGLFPFVSVLSVSVTKDVLFTAFFLLFVSLFVERHFLRDGKKMWLYDLFWVLSGIAMILFRNNALYAVAVFAVFYLILCGKKDCLKILLLCLLITLGGKGAVEGIRLAIGTEHEGRPIEMFSVQLQQFNRVGHYQQYNLDQEYYHLVYTYVPHEYWDKYEPNLADYVKNGVWAYTYYNTWDGHLGDMLKAWIKVGLKYPNDYVDAFLALNTGYWFIDDTGWSQVFGRSLETRTGALSTYMSSESFVLPEGIPHESKFPALENLLQEIVCANSYYDWPVVFVLFQPAFYCWNLLITVMVAFYIKNKKKIMFTLLPLIYLGTMFLGPVVQARYALPIMMVVPLMWAAVLSKREETTGEEVPETVQEPVSEAEEETKG